MAVVVVCGVCLVLYDHGMPLGWCFLLVLIYDAVLYMRPMRDTCCGNDNMDLNKRDALYKEWRWFTAAFSDFRYRWCEEISARTELGMRIGLNSQ